MWPPYLGLRPLAMTSLHAVLLLVLAAGAAQALSEEPAVAVDGGHNCSGGVCEDLDDDPPCPPDSALETTTPGSLCVCNTNRCVQPVCRHGSHKVLKQKGSGVPGDCCDVYECILPKEKNCSEVICPQESLECPPDSFHLPSHKGPHDCCSVPQGCQCLPHPCEPAVCGAGFTARQLRPGNNQPGTCCPSYECIVNDGNEEKGVDFVVPCSWEGGRVEDGIALRTDSCTVCNCKNGSMLCEKQCPPIPHSCHHTEIPDGECCPICVANALDSCMTNAGKPMPNGQKWQEGPCTTCVCRDGKKRCESFMCEVACTYPRNEPGECCPICDEWPATCPPTNCSTSCPYGFIADVDGCNTCICKTNAKKCPLECPQGYLYDQNGHQLCKCAPTRCSPLIECRKNCSHGFRLNKEGCEICRCNQCRPPRAVECNKTCSYGFRTNDKGCPICKCKASSDQYTVAEDNVTFTHCKNSDGDIHEHGETWFDGCRQCYCHDGKEMCNLITCPPLSCSQPVFNSSNSCCPHCPEDIATAIVPHPMVCQSVDGIYRVEGETWDLDLCTKCLCHLGRVLCETRQCPPTPCAHPIKENGQCCSQCPLTSLAPNTAKFCEHRAHGATWREKNCRSCLCQDGEEHCFTEKCSTLFCDRPVLVKNQCCPLCLDKTTPKLCISGNSTYQTDEEWLEDTCTHCKCIEGHPVCTPKMCPILCKAPVKIPDRCCPVCTDPSEFTSWLLDEWKYLLIIAFLLASVAFLILFVVWLCRRIKQIKSDVSSKSCSNPSYNGYTHRNSFPPPRYTSTDRQSKCEPYHYKYVPTYDSQQFDLLKSPSFGASEKTALAPV